MLTIYFTHWLLVQYLPGLLKCEAFKVCEKERETETVFLESFADLPKSLKNWKHSLWTSLLFLSLTSSYNTNFITAIYFFIYVIKILNTKSPESLFKYHVIYSKLNKIVFFFTYIFKFSVIIAGLFAILIAALISLQTLLWKMKFSRKNITPNHIWRRN